MTSDKLAKVVKILLYIVALTPLVVTPWTIFPFIFGRGLIVQFLIEVIFALYIILAIFDKRYRPQKNLLTALFGSFIFILFIASLFGVDFGRSFWSDGERATGWFLLAHVFLFFIAISAVLKTKKEWGGYLKFNAAVSLAMFGFSILPLFGVKFWNIDFGTRIFGPLGNPIFAAAYFILNLAFIAYLFCAAESKKSKAAWLACGLIIFYGVILTQSRGAMLGIAAGFAAALFFYGFFNKQKKARMLIIFAVIFAALAISPIFIFKNSGFVKDNEVLARIASISISTGTARTRLLTWQIAWQAIKERPFLGWGAEGFYAAFNQYYNPELLRYSYYETWSDKPHNNLLGVATDAGIPGALIYLSIFAAAGYLLYQKKKAGYLSLGGASVLAGGLTAYFVQNLSAFDTGVSYLLFAVLLAFIGAAKNREEAPGAGKKINYAILFPLAVIIAGAGVINFFPFAASAKLRAAFSPAELDATKKADMAAYREAAKYFNPYIDEWRVDLAKNIIASVRGGRELYNNDEALYVLDELKKNANGHPNNAYYHLLLGSFYSELGVKDAKYFDLAKEELDRALVLSPARQHVYFTLGRYYFLKQDKENLIATFQKAISLDPQVTLSYWEGAKLLYFLDNKDLLAGQWMIRAAELGFMPSDDTELLFLMKNTADHFLQTKNYGVLSKYYLRMEEIEPQMAKWHAQRATAEYLLGNKDEAVAEIKKAIEADNSYKTEGEKFIEIIKAGK